MYEYFSSTSDLLADLIIDELEIWATTLDEIVSNENEPLDQIESWIRGALAYVADGRHNLVKALSAVSMPLDRSSEITASHRRLVAPLITTLKQMCIADPMSVALLINSAVEAATKRIESGASAEEQIELTVRFARSGVSALTENPAEALQG